MYSLFLVHDAHTLNSYGSIPDVLYLMFLTYIDQAYHSIPFCWWQLSECSMQVGNHTNLQANCFLYN